MIVFVATTSLLPYSPILEKYEQKEGEQRRYRRFFYNTRRRNLQSLHGLAHMQNSDVATHSEEKTVSDSSKSSKENRTESIRMEYELMRSHGLFDHSTWVKVRSKRTSSWC